MSAENAAVVSFTVTPDTFIGWAFCPLIRQPTIHKSWGRVTFCEFVLFDTLAIPHAALIIKIDTQEVTDQLIVFVLSLSKRGQNFSALDKRYFYVLSSDFSTFSEVLDRRSIKFIVNNICSFSVYQNQNVFDKFSQKYCLFIHCVNTE